MTSGQGYDLSRHHAGRTRAPRRRSARSASARLTEGTRGLLERAEADEDLYAPDGRSGDRAVEAGRPGGRAREHDDVVRPAAEKLREHLAELELGFARGQSRSRRSG